MFQRLVKDERKNNNNSTQKEMMVHNVLVFGSGYGNCQSLRPNDGHDLNKTSESISSFNILPRDHHPNHNKTKTKPLAMVYSIPVLASYKTHTTEKEIKYKRNTCEMLCITSSERKKVILLCSLFLSDSLIATWPLMVKELDLIYLYDCTFVKLLAPKKSQPAPVSVKLFIYFFRILRLCCLLSRLLLFFFASACPNSLSKNNKKGQKY